MQMIAASPLFSGLRRTETERVIEALSGELIFCSKGELISENSQNSVDRQVIYLVLSGVVQLVRYGQDGRRCMIDYTMPGGVIGYADLVGGLYVRGSQYEAGKEAVLLRLEFSERPEIEQDTVETLERAFIKIISNKTSRLLQKVDIVSRGSVREKIMTFLSYEAQIHGAAQFDIPLNRQELADYICVDRTTLCSELGKMENEGLILKGKRTFRMLTEKAI